MPDRSLCERHLEEARIRNITRYHETKAPTTAKRGIYKCSNCGEPGHIAAAQRRLGPAKAQRPARDFYQRKAGARAEIKEPGKQQRIGDAEEQLGDRRAAAKQER